MEEYKMMYKMVKGSHDVLALSPRSKDFYACRGYIVTEAVYADRETILNARLEMTVKHYLDNEAYRSSLFDRYAKLEISRKDFYEAISRVDEYRWNRLHRLDKQVGDMLLEGYSIYSEVAAQLYDGLHGYNSLREVL